MSEPYKQWFDADKDGNGRINFSEFCQWAIKKNLDIGRQSESGQITDEDSEITDKD
jgi:EF hand